MDTRSTLTLAEQLAAAQDWWREAGVDSDFIDEPRNWLQKPPAPEAPAQAAPTPAAPPPLQVPALGGEASSWPQGLADFAPWWLSSDQLETGGTASRIAPRGAADAALMILVPMPEKDDSDRLLSGPQGTLIGNMLKAMGIADDAAYLAAALPRFASHPDWNGLAERELCKVLIHHIELARPRRLLILGRAMLPLFGHDSAQAGQKPRPIALQGSGVPALVTFGPENLLETARFRRALWQGWLDWTGDDQ